MPVPYSCTVSVLIKSGDSQNCVSFLVMQDRGLTDALTTDEHFQQAGFRALLREGSP